MSKTIICNMPDEAWEKVREIYKQGIDTYNATFEKNPPDWENWNKAHRKDCRLIAEIDGQITGWAALSYYSHRNVYSGVAEVSIYIDNAFQGQGIGKKLIEKLIEESEKNNIWTLQAGIFPENKVSIHLHLKYGFRIVGTRERIGKMNYQWRDVVLLERRSKKVGLN